MYTLRSSGVRAKYSLSISPSIRFLITTGLGKNRAFSCWVTSATKTLCCIFFLDFIIRTIAASISCFLSSSTFCLVSFLSGSDSPCLAATVWILTLCSLDVNWSLTVNMWPLSISLDLGSFVRTRCVGLPQARDWRALTSSLSGISVSCWISWKFH